MAEGKKEDPQMKICITVTKDGFQKADVYNYIGVSRKKLELAFQAAMHELHKKQRQAVREDRLEAEGQKEDEE